MITFTVIILFCDEESYNVQIFYSVDFILDFAMLSSKHYF